jgi:hypothetical protein
MLDTGLKPAAVAPRRTSAFVDCGHNLDGAEDSHRQKNEQGLIEATLLGNEAATLGGRP